ncbi:MAG: NUDIX hydrolase [Verrucomicrobia bacterium]|nr:NUDIX hydrolase [Verrucomicrobiota bacterium]
MKTNPKHCRECGGALATRPIEGRPRAVCPACGSISYVNPVPAAAVAVVEHGCILLVKRAVEPKKGLWSLPAGFLEIDETVQECAVRETKEETGLDVALDGIIDVITVFDDPRYVCLLVVFAAHVVGGTLAPGDDAAEAGAFGLDELPPIAFKSHVRVIRAALDKA